MSDFQQTPRTRLRRRPNRAAYDRETVWAILDEGLFCHVAFQVDEQPYAIPTIYARIEDDLYIHGSAASRMLRTTSKGIPICITVTHIDGLVLARSAFHHSVNYRSVVVLGNATEVTDEGERLAAMEAIVEHVTPGRWSETRPPTPNEMKQTSVLRLRLDELSAKVRTGPPVDDEADYALDHWAGVIPLKLEAGDPIPDPKLAAGIEIPNHVRERANR